MGMAAKSSLEETRTGNGVRLPGDKSGEKGGDTTAFVSVNRSKKSATLDFAQDEGRELLLSLAARQTSSASILPLNRRAGKNRSENRHQAGRMIARRRLVTATAPGQVAGLTQPAPGVSGLGLEVQLGVPHQLLNTIDEAGQFFLEAFRRGPLDHGPSPRAEE